MTWSCARMDKIIEHGHLIVKLRQRISHANAYPTTGGKIDNNDIFLIDFYGRSEQRRNLKANKKDVYAQNQDISTEIPWTHNA